MSVCPLDSRRDLCRDPGMSQPCDACVTSSLPLTLVLTSLSPRTHTHTLVSLVAPHYTQKQ